MGDWADIEEHFAEHDMYNQNEHINDDIDEEEIEPSEEWKDGFRKGVESAKAAYIKSLSRLMCKLRCEINSLSEEDF